VVLQSLHNLSDEQTEYLIRDRLSFMRFPGYVRYYAALRELILANPKLTQ
jgi:IS5 family transposase